MWGRWLIGLVVVTAMELPLRPQTEQRAPASTDVVRVTTRMVEVSFTVVDGHGNLVSNLTRDDFEMYDQGVLQQIASFTELRPPLRAETIPETRAARAPGYFSNVPEGKGNPAEPLTIVLFDQLNTPVFDQANAKEQLLAHFRGAHSEGLTAIFVLNEGVKMVCNYTGSPETMRESIARIKPQENTNRFAAEPKPAASGLLTDYFENMARSREARFYLQEERIRPTLEAFQSIAESLAGIPGRKNLVWLSASFPISVGMTSTPLVPNFYKSGEVYESRLTALARRMSEANIAVYPIDVRGVTLLDTGPEDHIPPFAAGLNWGAEGPAGTMDAATATAVASPDAAQVFTMHEIADWTGGKAFLGSNDLRWEIRQALADGQQNYLLSFYPQGVKWDGKFHELRVVVKHSAMKVRSRKGYFASSEVVDSQIGQEEQLSLAENSPLNCTSLPFTVRAETRVVNKVNMVRTQVDINAKQLSFAEFGANQVARVTLVFLQKDSTGQFLERYKTSLTFHLTKSQLEAATKRGLRFTTSVSLNSTASEFRLVMQDLSTGNIGALNFPIAGLPVSQ